MAFERTPRGRTLHRTARFPFLLALLLAAASSALQTVQLAHAQEKTTGAIHGKVLDRATRQPLPGANVVVVGTKRGAGADLAGEFIIAGLEPGTYHLRASALGYETREISELSVLPDRSRSVDFLLEPGAVTGEEVTVKVAKLQAVSPDLPTSSRNLRYEEVRRAPGAVEDVQRMIQALPGVAGESDQNNEIVVRGGSPFENLIVLDGIEVENINHFGYPAGTGGPVSALNPEFLQDVTFASGGFSARYGDKLSSVLDLQLREGSRERHGGAADFNMAGVGGNLEGPFPGKRGSFLVAYHKSYLDLINNAIGLTAVPHYWNAQGKFTWDLTPRHLLAVNTLFADDYIKLDEEGGYSRGAQKVDNSNSKFLLGARLRSLWGPGYTDLVVARTRSWFNADVYKTDSTAAGRVVWPWVWEDITETTWQASLTWTGRAFGRDEWSAGAGVKPITFRHDVWMDRDTTVYNDGLLGMPDGSPDTLVTAPTDFLVNETAAKSFGFLQYTWRPTPTVTAVAGIRYDGFEYSGDHTFAPRLSLQYAFHPDWKASLALGRYYQAQPIISYVQGDLEQNRTLPHSRADQVVGSLAWYPDPATTLSAEMYFKTYDHLLVGEAVVVRETTGDYTFRSDAYLPERTKRAWGFELFAHRRLTGPWYGTLSYSYGDAKAEDPAYGHYPASYDFRQVVTAVLGYRTSLIERPGYLKLLHTPGIGWLLTVLPINGDELMLSTRFRYISGRPYTRNVWFDEGTASPDPIYEGHWQHVGVNNLRYPDYQRWDVRVDNKHYFGASSLTFYLEIQNILNRGNVADYLYGDAGQIDTVYQFRIFFVGGVRYEF